MPMQVLVRNNTWELLKDDSGVYHLVARDASVDIPVTKVQLQALSPIVKEADNL